MDAWIRRLVSRYGTLPVSGISALPWVLPLSSAAGAGDLYGWTPGVTLSAILAAVLFPIWLFFAVRVAIAGREVRRLGATVPDRFELRAMSSGERAWWLAFLVVALALLGWLSAVATVDWYLLGPPLGRGDGPAWLLAAGTALSGLLLVAGSVWTWRRARRAYRGRISGSL